jgi:hypothetical protein
MGDISKSDISPPSLKVRDLLTAVGSDADDELAPNPESPPNLPLAPSSTVAVVVFLLLDAKTKSNSGDLGAGRLKIEVVVDDDEKVWLNELALDEKLNILPGFDVA